MGHPGGLGRGWGWMGRAGGMVDMIVREGLGETWRLRYFASIRMSRSRS
jgi:hypothetical protein